MKTLKNKENLIIYNPIRLKNIQDLEDFGLLPVGASVDPRYQALADAYDISLTATVLEQIAAGPQVGSAAPHIARQPVARQYVPTLAELEQAPDETPDPIGDHPHSPVKGIVHRYPDRVLLKVTHLCAVYCRYCFRRDMIGKSGDVLTEAELEGALSYIADHPEIWEVILTGGDPLVLSPRRLALLLNRLATIDHVKIIRIHSRVPIAAPSIVTDTLISVLNNTGKSIYLVLHINHAQELTQDVQDVIQKLHRAGMSLLSQSVLLRGVNDDVDALESLFKSLYTLHVKPYYLHHPDLARGTSHFRVSIARGQELMHALQGRISGPCLPRYILDIPGGYGKVPVTQSYITGTQGVYTLTDPQGCLHPYIERDQSDA